MEVKRWAPTAPVKVNNQLTCYQARLQEKGIASTPSAKLNLERWAVWYEDNRGNKWYAWAPVANEDGLDYGGAALNGHIYFAPEDKATEQIKQKAKQADAWYQEMRKVMDRTSAIDALVDALPLPGPIFIP